MGKPKLTLYFDIVSPFAYMGFYALENFPVFKQCEITYVPIFLGGLFKACGNVAPLQIKNKDIWINLERQRWAKAFSIPIADTPPPDFPVLSLSVQRTLSALPHSSMASAMSALWQAFWVERNSDALRDTSVTTAVLATALGKEAAEKAVADSKSSEVKARLAKNTDMAMESGAFGVPWYVATNSAGQTECFWGFDHIGQVVDHLGLDRPTSAGWKSVL